MRVRLWQILAVALLSCGCATRNVGPGGTPDSGLLRDPARAVDLSPDPHIVEINLVAAPSTHEFEAGSPAAVWTYNGSLPGPLIEASVGDEIVVHFTNNLPEETTVHWHGIRLPQAMDGSHASQSPVPPGVSFEYRFIAVDPGLYWYHPHHHSAHQVPMGLYGPLLVHGPGEPAIGRQRVIVLSDIELDSSGQVVEPESMLHDQLSHALGMEGNTQLVNGQVMPRIAMPEGGAERWRIVNAAGARYFRLGTGAPLTLIGVDGGLIASPVPLDDILLAPGERCDLVVETPAAAGALTNLPYRRLYQEVYETPPGSEIARIEVAAPGSSSGLALPATLANIEALPAESQERHFLLNVKQIPDLGNPDGVHHGSAGGKEPVNEFLINGQIYPNVPRFETHIGETEVWEVINHNTLDHPFHIHGFRFQVLDINGEPPPYLGWKDTVNIPGFHDGVEYRLRLKVRYDGHPGRWVYHCHILHHQEMGMMAEFDVLP